MPDWVNPFDFLIVLGVLVGAAVGFVRGLVRMALSVAILYVAAALGVAFHRPIGNWMHNGFGLPLPTSLSLAFVLVVIVAFVVIGAIVRRVYKETELPGIRRIDQLGGLVIGFFVGCLWVGLAVLVLNFLLTATEAQTTAGPRTMFYYFRQSALIPIFYDFLRIALVTLKPWMPRGIPPELLRIP